VLLADDNENSLAQAELYIMMATVFSQFEFELYETDVSDVEIVQGYLVPYEVSKVGFLGG
jgi:hypothetical protein